MRLAALLFVVTLAGCSGMSKVIADREALAKPAPLTVPDPAAVAPAVAAYRIVSAAAQQAYLADVAKMPPTPTALVDIGISAANNSCRDWFDALSRAEIEYKFGRGNVAIIKAALTTALSAVQASYGLMTGLGILSTADEAFAQQFQSSVLALADYSLQQKVWQVMGSRAAELRASAFTYPQALDAIRAYGSLCLPQAAGEIVKSALNATETKVSPAGTFSTTTISSAFIRDDSGERIVQFWAPGNQINEANEARLLAWMKSAGVNTSITFFASSKLYEAARKQAVTDLGIPPVGQVAPPVAPTSERTPEVRDGAFIARALGLTGAAP